jgi:hypothetical protein
MPIWRDRGFGMNEEIVGGVDDKALRRKVGALRITRLALMVLGIALIIHGVSINATIEILLAMVVLTMMWVLVRVQNRLRARGAKTR